MSAVDTVKKCWGTVAPPWVLALAKFCDEKSQPAVARELGYSATSISQVLNNKYPASLEKIENAVRGLLMDACVNCPVLGEIATHTCIEIQRRPFRPTNSTRVKLYKACRNGCAHYRGNSKG